MQSTLRPLILALALLVNAPSLFSQVTRVSGQVLDASTGDPLPFVNVTVNGEKVGTAADVDGKFNYTSAKPVTKLTFSFVGYEKLDYPVGSSTVFPITVRLKELSEQLAEVTVIAGENPAHRIIRKAVENREKNDPANLSSFRYLSYNKLVVGLNVDSLSEEIDTMTVKVPDTDSSYVKADSSEYETRRFFSRSHLFLMESIAERKFKAPSKDQELVLASRVSGFKDPTFVLLGTQFQSFSFYTDYVKVLFTEYLNPISPGSTKRYYFLLQDTTYNSATDTVYTIAFRPQPGTTFKTLEGLLYINTRDWALQNIVAEPSGGGGGFKVEIQQKYERLEGHWFPVQLNYDFRMGGDSLKAGTAYPYGKGRTFLKDISIGEEFTRKDFSGADIKIEDDATRKGEEFWEQYRYDTLTVQERNTYQVIDSIGEEIKLDEKLKWATALINGKLRLGYIDLDLDRILAVNRYEAVRLGLGIHTSPKFSKWLTLGGWAGYGFRDAAWKYGGDISFLLDRRTNWNVTLSASRDLEESGGLNIAPRERLGFGGSDVRAILINQFDRVDEARFSVGFQPWPTVDTRTSLVHQNRWVLGNYVFSDVQEGYPIYRNGINYSFAELSLRWAPHERYMEGPFGRRRISKTWPVYHARVQHSLPELADNSLAFTRVEIQAEWSFKTILLGQTRIQLKGGLTDGRVPYSFLFAGKGNNLESTFGLADDASFETMEFNRYLSDRYTQIHLRHSFGSRFFRGMKWRPTVDITTAALFGTLAFPEDHRGLGSEAPELGYYESGVELNNIFSTLGLGLYYRYGPYNTGNFQEDAAIKLTTRFSLDAMFSGGTVKVE